MNNILTRRQEKSNSGYSCEVLKSALQKYVRREELVKGMWCLIELDVFGYFESNEKASRVKASETEANKFESIQKNSRCIRSNMINRLIAIMSEEISICCFWLPVEMKRLYDLWEQERDSNLNNKKDANMLRYSLSMYRMLVNSNKCRLLSDLKTVYNLPPHYFNNKDKIDKCYERLLEEEFDEEKELRFRSFKLNEDKEDVMETLRKYLSNRDEEGYFLCLSKILEMSSTRSVINLKKEIWETLISFSDHDRDLKDVLKSLKFFFYKMSHKETWLYLYHASLLVLKRGSFLVTTGSCEIFSLAEVMQLVAHNKKTKLTMDTYIYDHHCSTRGIVARGDKINFALEGVLMKREYRPYLNEESRRLYIANKYLIEDILFNTEPTLLVRKRKAKDDDLTLKIIKKPKTPLIIDLKIFYSKYVVLLIGLEEVKRIDELPKAQLLTSKWKKNVNVDDVMVYKGPYDYKDTKLIRNLQVASAMEYLEMLLVGNKHEYFSHLLKCGDQFWLASRRIGNDFNIDDLIDCNKVGKKLQILKRNSFVKRISDLSTDYLTPQLVDEVLQHLYLRFLLNVGDSGPHNMLYCDDLSSEFVVQGIDFDESCMQNLKLDRISCLFKRGGEHYAGDVMNMRVFKEIMSGTVSNDLVSFGLDVGDINMRINFFNNLIY